MRFFNRIWEVRFSRRQIFLLCLLIGVLAAKGFDTPSESPRSHLLVHALPVGFTPGGSYEFDPSYGRELYVYARGGHVEECTWPEVGEMRRCLNRREEARRFIYEHWQAKERAYIAIDLPCVDCGPTMHVFIEPNEAGEWHIAMVLEEPRYPPRRWPDAFDLRYRKTTEDDRWFGRVKRVLSFRDRENAEIDYF